MLGMYLGTVELKIFSECMVRTELLNCISSGSSTAVHESRLRSGLHHVPSPEQLVWEGTDLRMRNGLELSTLITVLRGLVSGIHLT